MTERTWGNNFQLLAFLVVFLAGFVSAVTLVGKSGPGASFLDLLAAPGCLIPTVALTLLAVGIAIAGGHYGKQWMDARARVWQARAAREEATTAKQHAQANDLTPGPDGRVLARLVQDQDGNVVLVQPGVATAPVTVIQADAGVRPNETPNAQVMAAILADALAQAAQRGPAGNARAGAWTPDPLLYKALGLLEPMDERVPSSIQILTADEVKRLESGREE
jgi:uncharacterized membrane protein YciS (DUF1049 family)